MTESTDEQGIRAWSPGVMLAEELDADRDEAVRDVLAPEGWQSLRQFCRKFDVGLTSETTFADLDAIPASVWDACGLDAPNRAAVLEFCADYAYPLPDPEQVAEKLNREHSQRWAAHNFAERTLKAQGVAPGTEFNLEEVERVCGADVATMAQRAIEQHNCDTWNMGPAARRDRRDEHNYLVTAAELVGPFGVAADLIAVMTAATAGQRSAAWADLADAREAHRSGGVIDHDPVGRRWCTLDDLENMPAPGWLVHRLLPAGALTRLVGMSQSLKSFIALDMALAIATGTPFAGAERFGTVEPAHVIYVVGEGVHGIDGRVRAWCAQRRIDRTKVRQNLTILRGAAQLASRRDMAEVAAKVSATGARLVVFDTQARCTVELDENSATEQGRAIARLDGLVQGTGAAALVLHHTTKSDPRNARGSVAWTGAVDAELIAVRDGQKLTVDLEVFKMKDDESGEVYPLKAVKVTSPSGKDSLVVAPGVDPFTADPDAPIAEWTGSGSAYAAQMYALAQEHCIPAEGLTQSRLADIANEVVGTETVRGKERPRRRVCTKNTATAAVKLLVDHEWLVVAKRDPLGRVYYVPKDYPAPNAADVSALASA